MNLNFVFAKNECEVKKKIYASMGFAGILLAAGMLFAIFALNNGLASSDNSSDGNVINISEIDTLNVNATPGAQDYSRSRVIAKWQAPAEREAAAERFKAAQSEALKAAQGVNATVAMPMPGDTPHFFGPYPNYANSPMPGNAVIEWNTIALDIIHPSGMQMMSSSMSAELVYMGYVHAAIYDALVAIEGGYAPYNTALGNGDTSASRDAAIAAAAYGILDHFFPSAMLDRKYNAAIGSIPVSAGKDSGIAIGTASAAGILSMRSGDGLLATSDYTIPAPGPGVWRPTVMLPDGSFAPPVDPWMADMTPFLLSSASQFRPAGPPALDSADWENDFNEVKTIGKSDSSLRTPEQSEVAMFWTDSGVVQYNKAFRELAKKHKLNLIDTARLFAMCNMVATDAVMAGFDSKYHYSFWRPVTAIRLADQDGSPNTEPDTTWTPYIMTPNHPEYVAGHGTYASAIAEILTQFFGTDQIDLDLYSAVTKTTRHYATAADLREEIINARTWGGIHYRGSSEDGVALGQNVVQDILSNHFLPAPSRTEHTMSSGGIRKFVDSLPGLGPGNKNGLGQYLPIAVPDETTYPGCDYYEIELREYKEQMHPDLPQTTLRGYVQVKNGGDVAPIHYLGPIIVAERDTPVRIKFTNKLPTGSDGDLFLPVDTTVMGSGMGPNMIMPMMADRVGGAGATVEIQTMGNHNLQPGQMIMLHGFTPAAYNGEYRVLSAPDATHFQITLNSDPGGPATTLGDIMEMYTQNRATIHLHGGFVPWISDGTPHQWTTPANEKTSYPKGVSVAYVPDMWFENGSVIPNTVGQTTPPTPTATNNPGDGSLTFYYNNQQSARLMFYHDHSYGITRLNVYAGEAAGYLETDQAEKDMIDGTNLAGVNPGNVTVLPDIGIPLIVQDKTFVDANKIDMQDPLWSWGSMPGMPMTGDLWMPHVYMPNQNPGDSGGMNAFGRWHYGPWFWPPTTNIKYGPVDNPYYDQVNAPWEPEKAPGVPANSMAMESFMDTPVVNGAVYPYLEVEPKAYRFRILNAADDRFFNLQLYQASNIISGITVTDGGTGYTNPKVTITDAAGTGKGATAEAVVDPATGAITDVTLLTVGSGYTDPVSVTITDTAPGTGLGATAIATLYTGQTEVGMVPASTCAGLPENWPTDGRAGGAPDPATAGPSIIQIGNEGGFLPEPVELQNQPVGWNFDQTNFDFGVVNQGTLIVGPAERADVVIDFSKHAGKTLILYNDAPAPFPAIDPRYDYYTGHPDLTDTGGAPTTQPGYGPNTRTIMQIRVGNSVTPGSFVFDLAKLKEVFAKAVGKNSVFEASQDDTIVPQAGYNSAYNANFPADTYVRIHQNSHKFQTLSGASVTLPLEPKAIQDEMGEAFETDYGRMSGFLGLEVPFTGAGNQNFILYPFPSPPVEIVKGSVLATPIGSTGDGTQFWKITHNGVDTHTIHFHLFSVQLINRVAWDNAIREPDPNELGWKETVRVNPLQDTIVALRPVAPTQPFDIPNSVRLIDPTMKEGAVLPGGPLGFVDPTGEPVTVVNHPVNFGWEYMMHCHLLSHEEMDMMHAVIFYVDPKAPSNLTATLGNSVILAWTDNSADETGFTIERSTDANFTTKTTFEVGPDVTTYTDTSVELGTTYYYRVIANNVVGDTTVYPSPAVGFPKESGVSAPSNTASVTITAPIVAPTDLRATIASSTRIALTWIDQSDNELSFAVWRSGGGGADVQVGTVSRTPEQTAAVGDPVTFNDNTNLVVGNTYTYYVKAVNDAGTSEPSNTFAISFTVPAAPSGLTGAAVRTGFRYTVTLNWVDNANNENGFQIQRSVVPTFTIVTSFGVGADVTNFVNQNVARYSRGYSYRVRATNPLGNSGWSNVVLVNTP